MFGCHLSLSGLSLTLAPAALVGDWSGDCSETDSGEEEGAIQFSSRLSTSESHTDIASSSPRWCLSLLALDFRKAYAWEGEGTNKKAAC